MVIAFFSSDYFNSRLTFFMKVFMTVFMTVSIPSKCHRWTVASAWIADLLVSSIEALMVTAFTPSDCRLSSACLHGCQHFI